MAKLTLANIENVGGNPARVAQVLNENFAAIAAAFENTLSRDGTSPNQMEADLDLNTNTLDNTVLGDEVEIVDG